MRLAAQRGAWILTDEVFRGAPGAHFSAERHLRIGFGMPSRVLSSGLAAIDRLLAELEA